MIGPESDQELRIQLDVSVTIKCKHTAEEVRAMVNTAVRNFMPKNWKHINALRFAEEGQIYGGKEIKWTDIHKPKVSSGGRDIEARDA
jgi:hypothetical protein